MYAGPYAGGGGASYPAYLGQFMQGDEAFLDKLSQNIFFFHMLKRESSASEEKFEVC